MVIHANAESEGVSKFQPLAWICRIAGCGDHRGGISNLTKTICCKKEDDIVIPVPREVGSGRQQTVD